jgi:uncharacterized damage-inducible protein DinB
MNAFFKDKIEYTYQCNKEVIDMMLENPASFTERAAILIAHSLNAQNLWCARILGQKHTQEVWQVFHLEELRTLNDYNYTLNLKALKEHPISDTITYRNTVGEKYTSKIEDVLFHIINHATYHRGQIISEIKANGALVSGTDFSSYKR